MNRIIITEMNGIRYLLVYENDVLVECHPLLEEKSVMIGDIYLGRVQKKLKNIDAAFISLDGDNIGYLPLDDKPAIVLNRQLPKGLSSIAENDLILVQVVQEPQKMKQARVTGNISISGKYIALDLKEGSVGVSKRIKDDDIDTHLRNLVDNSGDDYSFGIVYRTACENALDDDIIKEYDSLSKILSGMIATASYERNTGLVSREKSEYISIIEDYGLDRIGELKTDIPDVYDDIINYFNDRNIDYTIPTEKLFVKASNAEVCDYTQCSLNILLYKENNYPLYKLLDLETEISRMLNKKVWLKSGGFLIIEHTEAMVVIDVNTGKAINKKDRDKHVLRINLEAAKEIALQLRLRNLSGMIMIDFINMNSSEDKKAIIACLRKEFAKDKISTNFIDITGLDVYEITRKKQRRPIYELIRNTDGGVVKCLKEQYG